MVDIVNYNALRNSQRVIGIRSTQGSAATANGAWVTLVNLTGKGFAYAITGQFIPDAVSGEIRTTVDGGTPFNLVGAGTKLTGIYSDSQHSLPAIRLRFDSSLKIEWRHTGSTSVIGKASVVWGERP